MKRNIYQTLRRKMQNIIIIIIIVISKSSFHMKSKEISIEQQIK